MYYCTRTLRNSGQSVFISFMVGVCIIFSCSIQAQELKPKNIVINKTDSLITRGKSITDSVYQLKDIIVVGKIINKEVIPAQVMTIKDIERLNALSVADAIRYFSGVQLKDYGGVGGLKTINIRSMGTNHMGVFYNGIQLGNAQNGQVDLGKFSLENIEEISLYNGQKSNVFQSARDFGSAGTIYLQTRTPRFEEGKTSNFRASLRAGSFGLLNPAILMEQKINEDLSVSFNGEWTNASGKYKFRYRRLNPLGEVAYDTTAVRKNGDINATRLEASLDGKLRKQNGKWKIHAYNYNSERGVPGAIVNNVWRNGERLWDVNSFLQGSLEMDVTKRYRTRINAKYAVDKTHYVNNDYRLVTIDNIYKQKEIYFSSANVYNLMKNLDISASYDFQWNILDADLKDFPFPTRYTHWGSLATSYNSDRFKIQASILGTFVHESVERYSKAPDKNEATPAVFAAYKILRNESLWLQAFYKKIFRMPTFNDLYYTDMGNANLKPEYATQYNLGINYTKEFNRGIYRRLNIQVDAYYNEITDKIIAYPKGQQFRWTMLNLGKVEIKGIDVSAINSFQIEQVQINSKLQYTYQKAQDFTNPADTYYGDQIPYIPWHSGSFIAGADWRGWSFNYSFIYVGERYNQQENIRYNYTQPWYTHDLSLARVFMLKKNLMKVSCEVNNVMNQNYDVILNYPMPLRNYRLSVSIEL
ncbi:MULTISPECIES: TonB-dependent receptor [unclassified Dysgonomonas]|uniref:TonB-dependent receptor plug domain-containing protein n=1 Tax=unclassified Dysgonomonas TaxID=2630389 RepID=UPI0025BDCD23|nr:MULTISPECIES: TonB-dependent receptor [unclassified Dysgonomonas]MDR2002579.1 TonB-dependent receptor [Prevotella sp.]HMM01906.1 TonB-dependent receptor [Dysgonomonas sp.]